MTEVVPIEQARALSSGVNKDNIEALIEQINEMIIKAAKNGEDCVYINVIDYNQYEIDTAINLFKDNGYKADWLNIVLIRISWKE